MILLFLIMRCTPTIRELIEATPLWLASLDRLPASRLLLPRSGLERSDFVRWHETDMNAPVGDVRSWGRSRSPVLGPLGQRLTRLGPSRPICERQNCTTPCLAERLSLAVGRQYRD